MGLAASQSRLLSLTSRLSDLELRSQSLSNQKMALATASSKASNDYVKALSNSYINMYSPDGTYTQATANLLTQYDAATGGDQLFLQNDLGQVLCSEDMLNYFTYSMDSSGNPDLEKFLTSCGIQTNKNNNVLLSKIGSMSSGMAVFDKTISGLMTANNLVGVLGAESTSGVGSATGTTAASGTSSNPLAGLSIDQIIDKAINDVNTASGYDSSTGKCTGWVETLYDCYSDEMQGLIELIGNNNVSIGLSKTALSAVQGLLNDEEKAYNKFYYTDNAIKDAAINLLSEKDNSINLAKNLSFNGADLVSDNKVLTIADKMKDAIITNYTGNVNDYNLKVGGTELSNIEKACNAASLALNTFAFKNTTTQDLTYEVNGKNESLFDGSVAWSGSINDFKDQSKYPSTTKVLSKGNHYDTTYDDLMNTYLSFYNAFLNDPTLLDSVINADGTAKGTNTSCIVLDNYDKNTIKYTSHSHTYQDGWWGGFGSLDAANADKASQGQVKNNFGSNAYWINSREYHSGIFGCKHCYDVNYYTAEGTLNASKSTYWSMDDTAYNTLWDKVKGSSTGYESTKTSIFAAGYSDFFTGGGTFDFWSKPVELEADKTFGQFTTGTWYYDPDRTTLTLTQADGTTAKGRLVSESCHYQTSYVAHDGYQGAAVTHTVDHDDGVQFYYVFDGEEGSTLLNGEKAITNAGIYKPSDSSTPTTLTYQQGGNGVIKQKLSVDSSTAVYDSSHKLTGFQQQIINKDGKVSTVTLSLSDIELTGNNYSKVEYVYSSYQGTNFTASGNLDKWTATWKNSDGSVYKAVEYVAADFNGYGQSGSTASDSIANAIRSGNPTGLSMFGTSLPDITGVTFATVDINGKTYRVYVSKEAAELSAMPGLGLQLADNFRYFYNPNDDNNSCEQWVYIPGSDITDEMVAENSSLKKGVGTALKLNSYTDVEPPITLGASPSDPVSYPRFNYYRYSATYDSDVDSTQRTTYRNAKMLEVRDTVVKSLKNLKDTGGLKEVIAQYQQNQQSDTITLKDAINNINTKLTDFTSSYTSLYGGNTSVTAEVTRLIRELQSKYGGKTSYTNEDLEDISNYIKKIIEELTDASKFGAEYDDDNIIEYYTNIFNALKRYGGVAIDLDKWTNADWLNEQLTVGNIHTSVYEEGTLSEKYYSTSFTYLSVDTLNDSLVTKAQADYEAEIARISKKEKKIDRELTLIETEHTAVQNQVDEIKQTQTNNIEKKFNLFS